MIFNLIVFSFTGITGLFMLLAPKAFYNETQAWKQNKPTEPSRAYILITRIIGSLVLLASLVAIVALLLLK